MKFEKEDMYKDFVPVHTSMDFISWIMCIVIFPLLPSAIRIYKLHNRISKMGKREQWLYQKALNDGMSMINLDTACAISRSRICNYKFDIPKELRCKEKDTLRIKL